MRRLARDLAAIEATGVGKAFAVERLTALAARPEYQGLVTMAKQAAKEMGDELVSRGNDGLAAHVDGDAHPSHCIPGLEEAHRAGISD